jgi:hypothetical protein
LKFFFAERPLILAAGLGARAEVADLPEGFVLRDQKVTTC